MFTKEYLFSHFDYFEGELFWKKPLSNRCKVGDIAGDVDGTGYRRIYLKGRHYKMHILIYIMFNDDYDPALIVDHKDRNKSNNIKENLRLVTKAQNNLNRDNIKGITYERKRKKWRAQISNNNQNVFLGRFDTEEEAKEAYLAAVNDRFA